MAKKTPTRKSSSADNTDAKDTFNVSAHALVPKHEICAQSEKSEVLARYGVQPNQMPRISAHDPAIRHLSCKQGDLIKITRVSETAGTSVFYRIVSSE
ncbi:TPA: DNA-directed RNA polymerase subunit H [Candidatus Woesearchaeota archaeon]|nr:DNA-directed RNA polymerase subunit H [Candidatus Woesearchaeota archaeon]